MTKNKKMRIILRKGVLSTMSFIIEGNAVYEIDDECQMKKEKIKKQEREKIEESKKDILK